jgi:acyl transferase domain-containing protein
MLLKPMEQAVADGDMIRGVIRATGSNQDGHTAVLTQPSLEAQEKLIRHVYRKAGLDFSKTRYVEAHGRFFSIRSLFLLCKGEGDDC